MGLTKTAITRPVFMLMLMLAALILGNQSRTSMRVEQNPEVNFGVITISSVYPGAGPDEMNTLVSRKIEEVCAGVNGIREVTASSQEGISIVTAQFEIGTNMDNALNETRSKVDAIVNQLPLGIEKPTISKQDTASQPVLYMVAKSDKLTNQELRDLADDKLKDMFSRVPGVASATVNGGDVREIQVRIKKDKLLAYGIGIAQVQRAIQSATLNVPSGRVVDGDREYSVRVLGEFKKVSDLENLLITISDNSNPNAKAKIVRLKDIATIVDAVRERTNYSRLDGRDAVVIVVQKTREGNAVEISKAIVGENRGPVTMEEIERKKAAKAPLTVREQIKDAYGIDTVVTLNQATQIEESISDLNFSLFFGIALVGLIVFIFLHDWRGTLIVSIAIPICIFATFIAMKALGFTINNLSMLALSLAVGVLVDDAIVVLENIYRHLRLGEDPREAAINGRNEIGLAAIAITLADVVVFMPIGFMGGIVGQFFRPLGIGFAITVLLSLFVSFTITPMLASRWYRSGEDMEHFDKGFAGWFERTFAKVAARYGRILEWSLNHRWFVFVTGNIALVAVVMVIVGSFTPNPMMLLFDPKTKQPGMGMMMMMMSIVVGFVAFGINYWPKVLAWQTRKRLMLLGTIVMAAFLMISVPGMAGPKGVFAGFAALMVVAGVIAFVANFFMPRFKTRFMLGAAVVGVALIGAGFLGSAWGNWKKESVFKFGFFPPSDGGQVQVSIQLPPGSSLEATQRVVDRVESIVSKFPDVKYVLSQVGAAGSGQFSAGSVGSQLANVTITLKDKVAIMDTLSFWKKKSETMRSAPDTDVAAQMLEAVGKIPGADIKVSTPGAQGFGSAIQMSFRSDDRERLVDVVQNLKSKLAAGVIPGVINVDISSKPGKPELRAIPQRDKLADYNVTVADVATTMRVLYEGNKDTKFRFAGKEYDIRVMMDLADRNNPAIVDKVPVTFSQGNPVYLSSVANIVPGVGVDKVDRRDRIEEVRLTADLLPGKDAGGTQNEITKWMTDNKLLPDGVTFKPLGQADVQQREVGYLFGALGIGFMLVYMLLASLYNNILYPFIIQLAQPQAMVGALLALMITDKVFNIVGFIGVIALVGLVGKNAILLVDYTNTLRERGKSRHDALVEAGPTRLRPILMTTLALIVGMLPVALAIGRGSEFRETIGITIIGGIVLSTALTLLVIPCSYTIFDDLSLAIGRALRRTLPPSNE